MFDCGCKGQDGRSMLEGFMEGFVLSFGVDKAWRRQGIGTALQLASIDACRHRQLRQMRGWCSYDATDAFQIKLRLGFAAVPGVQFVKKLNAYVGGAYFAMSL